KTEHNIAAEIEPIVFPDIYPLYGVSDVRSSATERNRAIQGDLLDQLVLAKEIILTAKDNLPLPILDELIFKIDKLSQSIVHELGPDDEQQVMALLRTEVETLFSYFLQN